MRYVALGDSYTIGTSVAEDERWPNQLADRIDEIELVANLGVDGATTADLLERQLPDLAELRPDLVSVLIGVNDVVQAVADADYERNVARILGELAEHVPPHRIVAVAVPDYTVTPRGADFGDPVQQSDAILRCNAILREACEQRAIRFVPEIFEISRAAPGRPEMLAPDGLHPSGLQYARWVDAIEPAVRGVLGSPGRTVAERA